MPGGRKIIIVCPNCSNTINYNKRNIHRYATEDNRLKCRVSWCDYVFTKDETNRILDELMLEWIGKTLKSKRKKIKLK